jgi:type I restriction enzyme R subunit
VAEQAEKYAKKLLNWYPCWQNPLPIVYLSNGKELLFRDIRNAESEYQSIQQIHTPREMAKIAGIEDEFAGLPYLSPREIGRAHV